MQVVIQGTGKRAKVGGWVRGQTIGWKARRVGWVDRHTIVHRLCAGGEPKVVVVVTLNGTPKQGGTVAARSLPRSPARANLQVPMDERDKRIRAAGSLLPANRPRTDARDPPQPVRPNQQPR
jgi:hypothetical protein